jgi:hypothetical protein
MPLDVISSEIISECLKEYGKGSLFFRTDGLQFEERRAELRREYLRSHPETKPEHNQAILEAAVTPGITKPEVTAAWGLLEEDTRTAFGHVTDDGRAAYAYFTGFTVGEGYALYFKDDVVVGVRQAEELVPPHELELEMRVAEEIRGLFYFYNYDDGAGLTGSDFDDDHADWNREYPPRVRRETVGPWSVSMIEQHLNAKGLLPEYLSEVQRLGLDRDSLSVAGCSSVALKVLPYPPLAITDEQGTEFDDEGISRTSRAGPFTPPEEWFWHVAGGRLRQVAFPSTDGKVELLSVQWIKGGLFLVMQVPLLVDGVSQFDRIEADWHDGDPIPRFKRVVKNIGYRTVRVVLTDAEHREQLARFATDYVTERYLGRYRLEHDVLAFTLPESALPDELRRELRFIRASWLHTDTLTQD